MPVSLLEVPKGIRPDAKKKLVQKMKAALNEVWPIPDVRVFSANTKRRTLPRTGYSKPSRYGRFASSTFLSCGVWTPRGISLGPCTPPSPYEGIANTKELMIFYNLYPLENVAAGDRLQSDNQQAVEAMRQVNGTGT